MTYQLGYTPKDSPNSRGYVMFDIEYYLKQSEKDKEKWYSELHCLPCVDGLTYFLKDVLKNEKFDHVQFVKDAMEIQELRGLLYERHDNRPKEHEEASDFHYRVFGQKVKDILSNFREKYGLWINID